MSNALTILGPLATDAYLSCGQHYGLVLFIVSEAKFKYENSNTRVWFK